MAKRHHRGRRGYLGGLPIMGGTASVNAVYAGAGLSLLGNALFNYINTNFINSGSTPGFIDANVPTWLKPLFGPTLGAVVLYFGAKHVVKKYSADAAALAAGSIAVGIAQVLKGGLTTAVSGTSAANYLNFAGAPVTLVTPGFGPQRQPGVTNYPGLNGRFGEVINFPSTRRQFGEVVGGPGFHGRSNYADRAALSGWSQGVMAREMEPI